MKQVFFLLRELRIIRKTIRTYRHILRKGRYIVYPSMRAIVLDDDAAKRRADPYFNKHTYQGKIAKLLCVCNRVGCFRNRANSTEEYEAIYIANNYDAVRETKLFAFETGKVLVVCVNEEERQTVLALHDRLCDTYSVPTVRALSMPRAYETSLIRLAERPHERAAIQSIATATATHVSAAPLKTQRVSDLVSVSCDTDEELAIFEELRAHLSADMLGVEIPLCAQHGDLSADNLLYGEADGKKDFFWIDWEHLGDRVFFYDVFFYILNTAVYSPDSPVLREFLDGKYDDILTTFFADFGLPYKAEHKREVFLAFALIFLKERVMGLGRTAALQMYRDFLLNNV